jgi:hypothetical protein
VTRPRNASGFYPWFERLSIVLVLALLPASSAGHVALVTYIGVCLTLGAVVAATETWHSRRRRRP